MSCSSVATGILVVVALIHSAITIVLIALVILVRCYCKTKTISGSNAGGAVVHPHTNHPKLAEEGQNTQAYDSTTTSSTSPSNSRRVGQFDPPVLETTFHGDRVMETSEKRDLTVSVSLPLPGESSEVVLDNPVAGENWDKEDESHEVAMKNKTIEELRRSSASSIKKPVSPFRRVSSPLNRSGHNSPLNRSGRFSIASVFSRKSADMSGDPEAMNLMTSSVTSPTNTSPRNASSEPEDDAAHEESSHILQHTNQETREPANSNNSSGESDPVPTIHILNATFDTSDC